MFTAPCSALNSECAQWCRLVIHGGEYTPSPLANLWVWSLKPYHLRCSFPVWYRYFGSIIPSVLNVFMMQAFLIFNCIIGGQTLASVSSRLDDTLGIVIVSVISLVVSWRLDIWSHEHDELIYWPILDHILRVHRHTQVREITSITILSLISYYLSPIGTKASHGSPTYKTKLPVFLHLLLMEQFKATVLIRRRVFNLDLKSYYYMKPKFTYYY